MMNKTIASLVVAGLAGLSGFSYAADNAVTQISSGVYVENTTQGCSILRDRVTVNTSNGVTLVYNCLTASSKVNLGACHASGSQKPTAIPCVVTGDDGNGNPTYNGANCNAAGQQATPVQTTEIDGRRGYTGSTTGGSVGQTNLNSETCTVSALGALQGVAQ